MSGRNWGYEEGERCGGQRHLEIDHQCTGGHWCSGGIQKGFKVLRTMGNERYYQLFLRFMLEDLSPISTREKGELVFFWQLHNLKKNSIRFSPYFFFMISFVMRVVVLRALRDSTFDRKRFPPQAVDKKRNSHSN